MRYYAHGRPLGRTSRLLEAQARAVSNQQLRLGVAREMYAMRFPGEDRRGSTMQQLRGREGARVRRLYRAHAERTGVEWSSRDYRPDDFAAGDVVNQALSSANTCLYGIVHAVIVALGCAPGLGFVHVGHDRSFVYDVADLYKAEVSIPVAFDIAARAMTTEIEDIGAETRRAVRDAVHDGAILTRCAKDVRRLLLGDGGSDEDELSGDVVELWDGGDRRVAGGRSYAGWADDAGGDDGPVGEPPW